MGHLFVQFILLTRIVYARDDLAHSQYVTEAKQIGEDPVSLYHFNHYGSYGSYGSNTRVTHKSYFNVLKEKLMEALIGIGLVVLAFPVLYYNEKRQAHMDRIFAYGEKIVKDGVKSAPLNSDNEKCLVNVQGETATQEQLTDNNSGITVQNCVRLEGVAQMYQWVEQTQTEERDAPGGGKDTITTYSYRTEWSSVEHDSSSFNEPGGHHNPSFYVHNSSQVAQNVSFGDYSLTADLITQMRKSTPATGPQQIDMGGRPFVLRDNHYTTERGGPEVGDMQYALTKVECGVATVLSIQQGNSFTPLNNDMVPSGCCIAPGRGEKVAALEEPLLAKSSEPDGICSAIGAMISMKEELNDLAEAALSAREMFARAKAAQGCIRKVLHVVGFFMFYFGFYMQFSFFPAVFRFIPFIGTWIESFGQFFAMLGAIFLAIFHYCLTVSVAWLVVRPLKGIFFLCLSVAIIVVPTMLAQQQQQQQGSGP